MVEHNVNKSNIGEHENRKRNEQGVFNEYDCKSSANLHELVASIEDFEKPKDGGWGWVVVFASFIIQFIGEFPSNTF